MGAKRREHYDDWWRCEVSFSPVLDELFGVTHTKQGIHPTPSLCAVLQPDMEAIARKLNARARAAFANQSGRRLSQAERVAAKRDRFLSGSRTSLAHLMNSAPLRCEITARAMDVSDFFQVERTKGQETVVLNVNHPFYSELYRPSLGAGRERERFGLECLLLSIARARASHRRRVRTTTLDNVFREWANNLATFLR
jgi:hypothetical protein